MPPPIPTPTDMQLPPRCGPILKPAWTKAPRHRHRGPGKILSAAGRIPMVTKADPQFKYYFCLHANETLNRLEQTPKLDDRRRSRPHRRRRVGNRSRRDIRIAQKEGGQNRLTRSESRCSPSGTGATQRFAPTPRPIALLEIMAPPHLQFEKPSKCGLINYLYEKESFWDESLPTPAILPRPIKHPRRWPQSSVPSSTEMEILSPKPAASSARTQETSSSHEDARRVLPHLRRKACRNFKGNKFDVTHRDQEKCNSNEKPSQTICVKNEAWV